MKVFGVTINYKNADMTVRCIKSMILRDAAIEHIYLINNDEDDFDNKKLRSMSDKVTVINNHANLGFAAAANIGIHASFSRGATAVLLVNNDAIFTMPIVAVMKYYIKKHSTVGIVGPSIEFMKDGKHVYDIGGYIRMPWGKTFHKEVSRIKDLRPCIVDYMSGCCLLISKRVVEKVGDFDERFFLYYEDVDICLRAKAKGYQTVVLPTLTIHHELSSTVGKVSKTAIYHQTRSALLFARKCSVSGKIMNMLFLFAQSCLFLRKNYQTGIFAFVAFFDIIVLKDVCRNI